MNTCSESMAVFVNIYYRIFLHLLWKVFIVSHFSVVWVKSLELSHKQTPVKYDMTLYINHPWLQNMKNKLYRTLPLKEVLSQILFNFIITGFDFIVPVQFIKYLICSYVPPPLLDWRADISKIYELKMWCVVQ